MSSSATSPRSSSKRAASSSSGGESDSDLPFDQPATKRRGKATARGTTDPVKLAERTARKTARMARNRLAAQLSRDRKKNETAALEAENESLKARLELEQLHTAQLKSRLGSLEEKFARLETLLLATAPATASLLPGTPSITTMSSHDLPGLEPLPPMTMSTMIKSDPTTDPSFRLAAREVESLQRKLARSTVPSLIRPLIPSRRLLAPPLSRSRTRRPIPLATRSPSSPSLTGASGRSTLPRPARRVLHLTLTSRRSTLTCSRTSKTPRFQLRVRR